MALVFGDRVYETSTTTGNGTLTLAGIGAANYRTFSDVIGNGNTCYYAIVHRNANEWEVGVGTVSAGALARTTVLKTSAGDTTKIVFSAGTKDVFNDYPAERLVALDAAGALTLTGVALTAGAASFTTGAFSGAVQVTDLTLLDGTPILNISTTSSAPVFKFTSTGNTGGLLQFIASNTQINWQISQNTYTVGALEITPSTATGGSTFTTPLITLSSTALTIGGALAITGALTGVTTITAVNSAAAQGSFSGWDETGVAGAGKGQILIGSTVANQGRIHYDDAGQTVLYIDNSYDATASTGIKLRVRTAGTPIDAIAIDGGGGSTMGGLLLTAAGTTARPSIRLPHGVAPTSPTDGDMWTTTAGLYVRINGVTVGPLS